MSASDIAFFGIKVKCVLTRIKWSMRITVMWPIVQLPLTQLMHTSELTGVLSPYCLVDTSKTSRHTHFTHAVFHLLYNIIQLPTFSTTLFLHRRLALSLELTQIVANYRAVPIRVSIQCQTPQFLALGLFLPLGIIPAVIICLFLAFLAVCDAAQRKSNVLTPTAVHLWAQPPIRRGERERQSSLTVRKGWVIAKNDLLCHVFAKQSAPCSPKSDSLQREATASEGTFRLFILFFFSQLSFPVNQTLISEPCLHPRLIEVTVVWKPHTFHCASLYYPDTNRTRESQRSVSSFLETSSSEKVSAELQYWRCAITYLWRKI